MYLMLIYDSRDSREIIEKCKKKSPCWKEAGEGKPVERQLGKRFIIPNSLAKQNAVLRNSGLDQRKFARFETKTELLLPAYDPPSRRTFFPLPSL